MENTLGSTQNTKYTRYEIHHRKYSSNIIKGFYNIKTNEGKIKEISDIVVMTGLNKNEGDVFINNVFKNLNT